MNTTQQEAIAKLVMNNLKLSETLHGQAQGGWSRGITIFLAPVAICALFVWGPVVNGWVIASISFGIALITTYYELFCANRRIDALIRLHEQLEQRIDKAQSGPRE